MNNNINNKSTNILPNNMNNNFMNFSNNNLKCSLMNNNMNIKMNNFMNNQNLNRSNTVNNNNNFACDGFNMNKELCFLNESRRTTLIDAFNDIMVNNPNNTSNNQDQKITMRFTFLNTSMILVEGKLNEKFSEVYERFMKYQCPETLKNYNTYALHETNLVQYDKTLAENNIKDGDAILFFNTKTLESYRKTVEKGKGNEKDKEKEKGSNLTEEEKEIIEKFLKEFICKKYMEFLQKMLFLKEGEEVPKFTKKIDIDEFHEFLKEKLEELGIKPDEHEHKLIYCLTNFDWKCSICNKNHKKNEGRYFCSECEYNMCDECLESKDYYKMKPFPDNITPSNKNVKDNKKKSKHHEHQLVYCRTKRTCLSCGWICDVCKENFKNDIWSFYCTICDFDQCCECFGIH
jgi:hypothetical protein